MRKPAASRRRQNQRGFALLLVFLMASAVALMLYMQMPREAFESERDKEQMLIDRGEQYKRAVYLYYVTNNHTWPSKMEDLENTNNKRFLRHRYIDPYTGKDEWRLIHTNGTFLTDSLVTPPPAQGTPGGPPSGGPLSPGGTLAGNGPGGMPGTAGLGGTLVASNGQASNGQAGPPEVNSQVQRRPSDNSMVQNSSYQNLPGGGTNQNQNQNDPGYQPFNPSSLPPISLYPNGYNAPPVNAPGGVNQANQNGSNQIMPNQTGFNQPFGIGQPGVNQPGVNQPGVNQLGFNQSGFNPSGFNPGNGTTPGITMPGTNFQPTNPGVLPPNMGAGGNFNQPGFNQPVINQGGQSQFAGNLGGNANQPGFNQPAIPFGGQGISGGIGTQPPTQPSNQAIGLINSLLTTPTQPPAGIGPNGQPQAGGGLAGVASTHKGAAIKVYAERKKYQEWEFVFQLNQQGGTGLQAPAALGPNGQPANANSGTSGPLGGPAMPNPGAMPGTPGASPGGANGTGLFTQPTP